MDRYTEFVKRHGSRSQVKRSLEILLPTSPIFDYLAGQIPHPAYSYIKMADIAEAEEKGKINREIGERRTRLGANIDQVVKDVKREVLQDSDLDKLFTSIIDWTDEDETRRRYEEKLLQHLYDNLVISEQPHKKQFRERVLKLSQGLVILKHPFALAWKIVIEWNDVNELRDLDHGLLTEYIDHFPEDGLSKVLRGYFECEICPFPFSTAPKKDQEQKDDITLMSPEDRLILMLEGSNESSKSTLSHRIMGEYFLYLSEYENAAIEARQAQKQLRLEQEVSGFDLRSISDAIIIILATALVQYQSPRHHPEAKSLFENVLQHKPSETSSLVGIGLILEEQGKYLEAIDFLNRSLERAPDVRIKAEVAWCKALIGDYDTSLYELEACLPDMQGADTTIKSLKSKTLYRIGTCLWERDSSKAARKDRNGAYARFLSSVQVDMSNAPAYTSLGIYYADYSKDQMRAQKCFQKAFELSASEVGAAERLAMYFAKSREWDLVEAVAHRIIIEFGNVNASGQGKKGPSWPYSALGVVQLNKQDFAKSVVSFQSALRLSPDHFHSWVGLGESYQKSGRYIAATRAFEKAQQIANEPGKVNSELVWFCNFMLANVKRELGEYEAALSGFREVLHAHPTEFGVALALLQTIVESAWQSIELGFYARSVNLAIEGIHVAVEILHLRKDAFDLWKSFADVCSVFSRVKSRAKEIPIDTVRAVLEFGVNSEEYESMSDLDGVGIGVLSVPDQRTSAVEVSLYAAILANKRSIYLSDSDIHASSIAWYNLGWAEYQAHVSNVESPAITKKPLRFLRAAVQCFKRAIEIEASNSEFWNSLGIATASLNPKVSQHSFVRSLHINERSARVWTNLGALYLAQKDHQLANAAFARAQSTDPDYAQAWLGQGILADQLGETEEAFTLFTHAFESTASSSALIRQQYAVSAFDQLLSRSRILTTGNTLQPRLALQQLRCQQPNNLAFQNLSALYDERADDFSSAVQHLERICSSLEFVYEASELPMTLAQFSQAKAELSRVQLTERDFVSAAENAQTTIDLTADETSPTTAQRKQRLSAHMSAGLAHYYQGLMDSAIVEFRSALEETEGDPDIICLLAKLLWTKGGKEERTVALDQLLDCIERSPGHFDATIILGAIAILEQKKDLIETISEDLQRLRTHDDLNFLQLRTINYLLNMMAILYPRSREGEDGSNISAATTAVMISPSQPYGWSQLAELNSIDAYPTEMALLTAVNAVPPRGSLRAEDLCEAYAGTRRPADAQRAIMVAPWTIDGWAAFL